MQRCSTRSRLGRSPDVPHVSITKAVLREPPPPPWSTHLPSSPEAAGQFGSPQSSSLLAGLPALLKLPEMLVRFRAQVGTATSPAPDSSRTSPSTSASFVPLSAFLLPQPKNRQF